MKHLQFLLFIIAGCSANLFADPVTSYRDGDRYFYFAGDDDEVPTLIDSHETIDEEFINQQTRDPANNGYWLYTRNNPLTRQVLIFGDASSVSRSNFNDTKVTVFLAHGWNGNGFTYMNNLLTEAFLRADDVNVIVLDWNQLAKRNYITAKYGASRVGQALGEFVNWLVGLGVSYEKVHLVGYSLGGHLVGSAGRQTGGNVKRITALDPAGPLWLTDSNRIRRTDGQYVEVIHTNTAFYGYTYPCGDADFYPNGGVLMPGCTVNSCSHGRSYRYLAASLIYNHFLANECSSYFNAVLNRCTGPLQPMGNGDLNAKK
ncbi:pancreatic triacylglycerol lipase-like [Aphomia sociella]